MTDTIAEQALLPFALIERERPAPVTRPVPTRRPRAAKPDSTTALIMADPSRIAFHPAFGAAEDLLARRYKKDVVVAAAALRGASNQAPLAVSAGDETGSYILLGHPVGLLAARIVHADDPGIKVAVVMSPPPEPAAHYAGMTRSLRRPGDWERYMVARYQVERTGSSRAAMEQLGLDPVRDESGFSRLLSVGKLLAAIPRLDPLTVSATIAARVMALRSDRSSRTAMDRLIEEATSATTGLLDARRLLPRLIAAADPGTAPPAMVRVDPQLDVWAFQRTDGPPLARVALVDQVWSAQFLEPMDATTWRVFSRAVAALMSRPVTLLAGKRARP